MSFGEKLIFFLTFIFCALLSICGWWTNGHFMSYGAFFVVSSGIVLCFTSWVYKKLSSKEDGSIIQTFIGTFFAFVLSFAIIAGFILPK